MVFGWIIVAISTSVGAIVLLAAIFLPAAPQQAAAAAIAVGLAVIPYCFMRSVVGAKRAGSEERSRDRAPAVASQADLPRATAGAKPPWEKG